MVELSNEARYRAARRVALFGAAVNFLLGIAKTVGGVIFYSHALIADGIHSFADLFTDLMVVFASKLGSEEADERHPYGHQRIETTATLLLSLFLIIAGGAIGWNAIEELFIAHHSPDKLAILIAMISILANEGLFHYTRLVGHRIQSDLLVVNAWHHRSDSLSSLVVAIGLLATWFGFGHLDAVAAIIVALMIIKMGWNYSWNSVRELIDTAVDDSVLAQIQEIIASVHGVLHVHQLRTRLMGGDIYIDVHVQVAPKISVSEGHHIAQNVHRLLLNSLEAVKDVTVHIDPEDDEMVCPSFHLPSRKTIERHLFSHFSAEIVGIKEVIIHYLDGEIYLDFIINQNEVNVDTLAAKTNLFKQANPAVKHIRFLHQIPGN